MPKSDNLEQRLRESRQRERLDLQPPEDGWEKLSGLIRPVTVPSPAPSTGIYWWGWALEATLFFMVLVVLWSVFAPESADMPEQNASADERIVEKSMIQGVTEPGDSKTEVALPIAETVVSLNPEKAEDNQNVSGAGKTHPTVETTTPAKTQPNQADPNRSNPGVPDIRDAQPNTSAQDGPIALTVPNAPDLNPAPLKINEPSSATHSASGSELGATGLIQEEEAVRALGNERAGDVDPLRSVLPSPVAELPMPAFTDLQEASPAAYFSDQVANYPASLPLGFVKSLKPKARAEWQLHASYNSIFSFNSYIYGDQFYERGTGDFSTLFVLPTGETVTGIFNRFEETHNKNNSYYFRGGIDRQTSSGFLFTLEGGFYKNYILSTLTDLDQVGPNEIRDLRNSREIIITAGLGLQYTFMKRRRFRPYVGAELLGFLYYNGYNRQSFYDQQTQSIGLVEEFSVKDHFPNYAGFALVGGFQYKFSQRLSGGVSLFINGGYDLFIAAPIGLEVRYSLK